MKEESSVLPLNSVSMHALLEEGRALRSILDSEKEKLSFTIAKTKKRIEVVDELAKHKRAEPEFAKKIKEIFSNIDIGTYQPKLVFKMVNSSPIPDFGIKVKQINEEIDELERLCINKSRIKSSLAIEEQQIYQARCVLFQETSSLRQHFDKLLSQKDNLEKEMSEIEDLIQFWKSKNDKAKTELEGIAQEINAIQSEKDKELMKLMEELSQIFTSLDEASQKLRSRMQ